MGRLGASAVPSDSSGADSVGLWANGSGWWGSEFSVVGVGGFADRIPRGSSAFFWSVGEETDPLEFTSPGPLEVPFVADRCREDSALSLLGSNGWENMLLSLGGRYEYCPCQSDCVDNGVSKWFDMRGELVGFW